MSLLTALVLVVLVLVFPLTILLPYTWHYSLNYISSLVSSPPSSYHDYIVVGSGSAGSVVAGRLAQAGHSVLLLEAGGPSPTVAHVPGLCGLLQNTAIDWAYRTEPQLESLEAYNGVSSWPRGRVLGGSSMLNYMLYVRGHSGDYDEWRDELGLEGWGYDEVLHYFKKAENMESEIEDKDQYHGDSGPLRVTSENFKDPLVNIMMKASAELGYKIGDINGNVEREGFSPTYASIRNGSRTGTFKAYAEHYMDRGLTVLPYAHVNKVIIENKVAVGVEVERFGVIERYYADREVILSAGAVGSPQILMLSGVGDKVHLDHVGVETVHHLPQVGHNLQDHLAVPLAFNIDQPLVVDPLSPAYPSTWWQYLVSGAGPMTRTGGVSGTGQVHTSVNTDHRPDVQMFFLDLTTATDYGLVLSRNMGMTPRAWSWSEDHLGKYSATILPSLSRPRSRGFIKLRSNNPRHHPIIQPNYLTVQHDVDTLVAGVDIAIQLLETQALKNVGAEPWGPVPHCRHLQFRSREYWECHVRGWAATIYHPVGTCAMGTVLDARMRVKGIGRLRVIDGSAMPRIVGGNTNAPIIMMAEKGADMLIQDTKHFDMLKQTNQTLDVKIALNTEKAESQKKIEL